MFGFNKKKTKRIAVMTAGGDCPGLNMVIKTIASYATDHYNWEVIGVKHALNGLVEELNLDNEDSSIVKFSPHFSFGEYLRQGGTFLGSFKKINKKKYRDIKNDEELAKAMLPGFKKNIKALNIDGIIATGGDGSMFMINYLCHNCKIPFVGIPKTIDNDTPGTEISVGFSSAVDSIVYNIDNVYWSAKGHRRAVIVQVMGRDVGHLAMHSGLASGADVILVPEIPYTLNGVISKLKKVIKTENREHFIIVVAEGAGYEKGKKIPKNSKMNVAEYIEKALRKEGIEARSDVFGYFQRGSLPNGYDRMIAAELATFAVDLMATGHTSVITAFRHGRPIKMTIKNLFKKETRGLNLNSLIVSTALKCGTYIGEIKQKIKKL